jgi:ferredoxin-nitrite reductase
VKLDDGTRVDGCTIVLGGGMDQDQGLARELVRSVPFDDVPPFLARVLTTYLREREGDESFAAFTRRHDEATLKTIFLESADVV